MKPEAIVEQPRLLDINSAGLYLGGISPWTIRSFVAAGHLRPVKLPACHRRGENGRRILFDRKDLDRFIDERRHA